jgi:hypothetical protein
MNTKKLFLTTTVALAAFSMAPTAEAKEKNFLSDLNRTLNQGNRTVNSGLRIPQNVFRGITQTEKSYRNIGIQRSRNVANQDRADTSAIKANTAKLRAQTENEAVRNGEDPRQQRKISQPQAKRGSGASAAMQAILDSGIYGNK